MSDSGTLTVYQRMPDQLEAVKVLGTAIAKSGMFGCGSVEAGMVFATECMFRNLPPLSLAQRYHVIFGKLSMKAEAMLAGFEAEGGKYSVVSRTPDLISIEFTPPSGKTETLSLSWEDAQKEPFAYEGKEEAVVDQLVAGKKPKLKPKYATPRSRMQMLWARLVSDSVRFLCPRVVTGVYTPEEIEDFDDSEVAAGRAKKNGSSAAKSASVAEAAAAKPDDANVVDVEFTTTTEPPPEFATPTQRQRIEQLFDQCGMTADQRTKALAKRHCNTIGMKDLLSPAAVELIAALESKLTAVKAAHEKSLPELTPGSDPTGAACGPCTAEQEQRIKSKLAEWAQIDKPEYNRQMTLFKKKLVESGRQIILDLSASDAARLYDAIGVRNMDSFIKLSLETWKPLAASVSNGDVKSAAAESKTTTAAA